jgi:hypothetical protein
MSAEIVAIKSRRRPVPIVLPQSEFDADVEWKVTLSLKLVRLANLRPIAASVVERLIDNLTEEALRRGSPR